MTEKQRTPEWYVRETRGQLRNLIFSDKWRAASKYRSLSVWWNPERVAFWSQVAKRYNQLDKIAEKIPKDKEGDDWPILFYVISND